MIVSAKVKVFFRSVFNGMAGILVEITAAALFIFAGFLVCLLWWSMIR